MSAPTKRACKKALPEPLTPCLFKLFTSEHATLANLAADATDQVGRTISQSAIVRGLIRFADSQGEGWVREHLLPHIEKELDAGVLWGKKQGEG